MKFKFLSIGTKFQFENETYLKTSPMIASNIKTGENRLIPRYAELTIVDEQGKSTQKNKEESISSKQVLDSFNIFYESCINLLDDKKLLLPEIKDEMDKARDNFTQSIFKQN